MSYILDTNTCIARLNGNSQVADRLRKLNSKDVILAAPTFAELEFGAWNSHRREENLDRLHQLAAGLRFEAFGDGAARVYGKLKATLRKQGISKSDIDLMLAAMLSISVLSSFPTIMHFSMARLTA